MTSRPKQEPDTELDKARAEMLIAKEKMDGYGKKKDSHRVRTMLESAARINYEDKKDAYERIKAKDTPDNIGRRKD